VNTHRIQVLDRADDDDVVVQVANHLELELVPAAHGLLHEHLADRRFLDAALDLRPQLGGIRNPTLVMCGALDQTTPAALAQEAAKAIPGALYREIAGSGHCPMLEQPQALAAAMNAFLGSGA
jgi:pimeloyl-ACP methyl ester carboxylesterase